ncbi:cation/calcium exchanger 1 [Lycium barbarum]|uniref:cation/calcium exchanger 1 n=1 Tax=Lycium barbarum TaxID=112863 RepID=UPI00293E1935|nr:cation/calcium exchanger 1 [Lycium barbarum]
MMHIFPFHFKPRSALSIILNTSFLFLLLLYTLTSNGFSQSQRHIHLSKTNNDCSDLHKHSDSQSKCAYIKANSSCSGKGYLNYLEFFYCTLGWFPQLGYCLLLVWLVLLFYLLGNTAAEYFCPSAEGLSKVMNLSPAIAGTTLLPLGNGANDVFSSIISFTRSSSGSVGLNSVLGGALFITCFVVGVISILVSTTQGLTIDKPSFIRDVLFIIFSLSCLLGIVVSGGVTLWIAICFSCIYVLYICVVCAMHFFSKKEAVKNVNSPTNSIPATSMYLGKEDEYIGVPLLGCIDEEKGSASRPSEEQAAQVNCSSSCCKFLNHFLGVLELPLYLPRRLTIPVVSEESWSKPMAVISVTLAPILAATVLSTPRESMNSRASLAIGMISVFVGLILGNLAFLSTKRSSPPTKCLFIWLLGGFVMSTTWTYMLAQELVSMLVSFGYILGINPSILGLTVLAWGNSTGDLISNVAMALNGGKDGVQMAISACYAGPLFNTLIGLGVSLVLASWWEYPTPYVVPNGPFLCETLGFLVVGLLWALVILPKRNMQPDHSLGVGLLAIYFCFLFLRFTKGF